jgi:cobalamin-dependent methionine synthase I
MKIIGEKINGTRQRVAQAIAGRDADYIQKLAQDQAEAGADWLDVNAGTKQSNEPKDLIWLVETVQSVVDIPLCLDSPNPAALTEAIQIVERTPMINSISGEPWRLDGILPLVAKHRCPVIALAMDDGGIPETCAGRIDAVHKVMQASRSCGVPDEDVYIDPLVMTLATDTESANITLETMRLIHAQYPDTHMSMGLSNISFGMPARANINRVFLILAVAAGLDSAIVDPMDRELKAALLTTQMLLGRDRYCLNYTRAYRAGLFNRKEC